MKKIEKDVLMEQAGTEEGSGVSQTSMTPEEVAARLAMPEGTQFEGPLPEQQPKGDDNDSGKEKEGNEGGEGSGSDFKPSSYWDIVKDTEGFEMPENVTKENEMELLKPYIAKKFGIEEKEPVIIEEHIHPVAKKVQDLYQSNPNITLTEVARELTSDIIDTGKMTDDQLIRMDFIDRFGLYDEEKNPEGVTEEEIEESIEGMSRLDKKQRAALIKESIEARNIKREKEHLAVTEQQRDKAYNDYLEVVEKTSSDLLAGLKETTDIYGVKVSQSDLSEYLKEFKDFLKPDKATGERKLDKWLSNDQTLFKLFVLDVMRGEDSMKELITQGREAAKEEILNRLKLTPPTKGSQGTRLNMQDPETIRLKLSSPEGAI